MTIFLQSFFLPDEYSSAQFPVPSPTVPSPDLFHRGYNLIIQIAEGSKLANVKKHDVYGVLLSGGHEKEIVDGWKFLITVILWQFFAWQVFHFLFAEGTIFGEYNSKDNTI